MERGANRNSQRNVVNAVEYPGEVPKHHCYHEQQRTTRIRVAPDSCDSCGARVKRRPAVHHQLVQVMAFNRSTLSPAPCQALRLCPQVKTTRLLETAKPFVAISRLR